MHINAFLKQRVIQGLGSFVTIMHIQVDVSPSKILPTYASPCTAQVDHSTDHLIVTRGAVIQLPAVTEGSDDMIVACMGRACWLTLPNMGKITVLCHGQFHIPLPIECEPLQRWAATNTQ